MKNKIDNKRNRSLEMLVSISTDGVLEMVSPKMGFPTKWKFVSLNLTNGVFVTYNCLNHHGKSYDKLEIDKAFHIVVKSNNFIKYWTFDYR